MTDQDKVGVEECHIRTRCMCRNDISGPDVCGGMTYPDQMDVEE
jgi:hypothetical protein